MIASVRYFRETEVRCSSVPALARCSISYGACHARRFSVSFINKYVSAMLVHCSLARLARFVSSFSLARRCRRAAWPTWPPHRVSHAQWPRAPLYLTPTPTRAAHLFTPRRLSCLESRGCHINKPAWPHRETLLFMFRAFSLRPAPVPPAVLRVIVLTGRQQGVSELRVLSSLTRVAHAMELKIPQYSLFPDFILYFWI